MAEDGGSRSIRRVCINCSKVRHVNLLSSCINHKTTGSGPVDDLAQPRLTIKSCKLLQTHCGPRVRIPTVLGTRTRVRPVLTYLPDLLARASLLIQSLAYLLIPPPRMPYPPHRGFPRLTLLVLVNSLFWNNQSGENPEQKCGRALCIEITRQLEHFLLYLLEKFLAIIP